MKVLECFSGTQSISKAFRRKGHQTFTIDNDPYFEWGTDISDSILNVTADRIRQEFGEVDILWASPPCTAFSVASISHHWQGGDKAYIPKTEFAKLSQDLVKHTLTLIEDLQPRYYFIENPRGILRKLGILDELPLYTVTYCQYGDTRMKPTDIWTNAPVDFKPMCKNGDPCHESSPRGSRTGTQGLKNARERSKIPKELCEYIVDICEKENLVLTK